MWMQRSYHGESWRQLQQPTEHDQQWLCQLMPAVQRDAMSGQGHQLLPCLTADLDPTRGWPIHHSPLSCCRTAACALSLSSCTACCVSTAGQDCGLVVPRLRITRGCTHLAFVTQTAVQPRRQLLRWQDFSACKLQCDVLLAPCSLIGAACRPAQAISGSAGQLGR